MHRIWKLLGGLAVVALGCDESLLTDWGVSLENHRIVGERRLDRSWFEYRIRADCHNTGPTIVDSIFQVRSSQSDSAGELTTEVIEGTLRCGHMASGATSKAVGEIVLYHDRRVPFDLSGLEWIAAGYGPDTKRAESDISRTRVQYTYDVVWTRSSGEAEIAQAYVTSLADATQVHSDSIAGMPSSQAATFGQSQLVFEHDRSSLFDPLALQWTLERPQPVRGALAITQTLDENGHPLGDVGIADPGAEGSGKDAHDTADAQSDAETGVATLEGEAGAVVRRFFKEGYLPVWRSFALVDGKVERIASPWLAARSEQGVEITVLNGGELDAGAGAIQLTFAGGAVSESTTATLTALSAQTLPGLLPLGWSPLQAFWLELDKDPQASASGFFTLWGPVAASDEVALVRFDTDTRSWVVLAIAEGSGSREIHFDEEEVSGEGAYAVVVADTGTGEPPPAVVDAALGASELALPEGETLSASGEADPPMRTASLDPDQVRSTARIQVTGEEGVPLPSGTALRAHIFESYSLRDGDDVHPPGHFASLSAFRRPASPGTAASDDQVYAYFPLRPQRVLDASELVEARVTVEVLPLADFDGGFFSAEGGSVGAPGVEIVAAAGDLAHSSAAELVAVSPARFDSFLPVGSEALVAFDLQVDGVADDRRLRANFGTLAGESFFVLARAIAGHGFHGLEPVERFHTDGAGNVQSSEPRGGARLPGVTRSGRYVLFEVPAPQLLVTGVARDLTDTPRAGLVVRIAGQPWLTFSKAGGAFALVAPAGAVELLVFDPRTGNEGIASLEIESDDQTFDASVVETGPAVVSTTPGGEAKGVDVVTPITVLFSEPLAPDSVVLEGEAETRALVLRPLDAESGALGAAVAGAVRLNLAGDRLSLLPDEPLMAATEYRIVVASSLEDLQALPLEGTREFGFATAIVGARGVGAQLVIYEPGSQKGIKACTCKDPETDAVDEDCQSVPGAELELPLGTFICVDGKLGAADPEVPVILVNDTTGMTATVDSKVDGSFKGMLLAGEEDFVSATFVNANDSRIRIPVQRQLYDDGSVALYPGGGILEASNEEAGKVKVFIAPEAVESRTKFKVAPLSLELMQQLMSEDKAPANGGQIVSGFEFDMSGGLVNGESEVEMTFDPAQYGLDPDADTVQMAIVREIEGQTVYQVVDEMSPRDSSPQAKSAFLLGFIGGVFVDPQEWALKGALQLTIAAIHVQGKAITLAGTVCESDLGRLSVFGWRKCDADNDRVVPGAFVRFEPIGVNFAPTGRIQGGMVYATSELDGEYALSIAAGGGEGVLLATHPRFSRPASTVAEGIFSVGAVLDPFGEFFAGLAKDLVFHRTVRETLVAARRPEVSLTHYPVSPAAGESAQLRALLSHSKASQWACSVSLVGPPISLTDTPVEEGDITIGDRSTVPSEDGRTLLCVADVSSPEPAVVTVEVRLAPLFQEPLFEPIVRQTRIAFDGEIRVGTNVIAPADPEDDVGPVVEASFPASGWRGFSPGDALVLHFNEPVDDAIVNDASAVVLSASTSGGGDSPRFSLHLGPDQRTLTVVPGSLQTGIRYVLSVGTGVVDLAGNDFDQDPAVDGAQPFVLEFESQDQETQAQTQSELPGLSYGRGVALRGAYAYALDAAGTGSLKIYDVSVPSAPTLVSETLFPSAPRDLALIPDYSFKLRPDAETRRADLLVAVGGDLEITSDPDSFASFLSGQYLRVFDLTDPTAPVMLANRRVTLRPAVVDKVVWSPPHIAYHERGADLQQVGIVDLQTLLLGFHQSVEEIVEACVSRTQTQEALTDCARVGLPGVDLNSDGDYVGEGESLPVPPTDPVEFSGKVDACLLDLRLAPLRMLDFDYSGGYCGVTMAEVWPDFTASNNSEIQEGWLATLGGIAEANLMALVEVISGSEQEEPPLPEFIPAMYLTLKRPGFDVPVEAAQFQYEINARPKRVRILPQVELDFLVSAGESPDGDGELVQIVETKRFDIALVSLSPDTDGVARLDVLNIGTLPPTPLARIPLPESMGLAQSIRLREDGLLALSMTQDVLLLDLRKLALPGPEDSGNGMFHPAIAGVIPGAGSGAKTLANSSSGLNLNALGSRNAVVQTAPRFRFVSFPTEDGEAREDLVRPSAFNDDLAAARALLDDMQIAQTFVPARFRAEGEAAATLGPPEEGAEPSPKRHYHVLVDAPGGAGEEIPLSLEGLNAAGHPLSNRGGGFPPVRALEPRSLEKLGQEPREGCDAPIAGLKAHRLSSDPRDPLFNRYLSDPFALVVERISIEEMQQLNAATPDRPVLWSPEYLRVGIDPAARGNPAIGPFAMRVDEAEKTLASGASKTLPTLSGFYLMGRNPPPVGGDLVQPGSLGSVSARSGEARIETVDITLPGRGMPIVFERTLAGQDSHHSVFGPGWDFTYGQRLVPLRPSALLPGMTIPLVIRAQGSQGETAESGDILLQTGAGRVALFEERRSTDSSVITDDPLVQELGWDDNGDAFYTAATPGVFDILIGFPGGEFVRLTPDGKRFWYSERGVLQRVQDRYPKNEHVLSYTRRGELRRITDHSSDGRRYLELGYFRFESDSLLEDGLDEVTPHPYVAGKVARLRDFTGRDVLFFYTEDGVLERREDVEVENAGGEGFFGRLLTQYQRGDGACGKALGAIVAGGGEQGGIASSPVTLVAFEYDEANSANSEQPVVGQARVAGQAVPLALTGENSAEAVGELTGTSSLPDQSTTSFEWDELGYPSKITLQPPSGKSDAGEPATTIPVYRNGLLAELTLPEGDRVVFQHDTESEVFRARGNPLSVERIPGSRGGEPAKETFSDYDLRYNQPTELTDANGKVVTVTLTPDGRDPARRESGGGAPWSETFAYNDFGQLERHQGPSGRVTAIVYDARGFPVTMSAGEGTDETTTRFAYDDTPAGQLGQATTVTPPTGLPITTAFDARLMSVRLARGERVETRAYDRAANVIAREVKLDGSTSLRETHRYDELNFLLESRIEGVSVDGTATDLVTRYTPDSLRRVAQVVYPGGEVESLGYDHQGRTIRRVLGGEDSGHTTETVRDRMGNVLEMKLQGTVTVQNTYDGHDRLVESKSLFAEDQGFTAQTEYFPGGEIKRQVLSDAQGQLLRETSIEDIDSLGRPTVRVTSGSAETGNARVEFGYSADGLTATQTGPRENRSQRADTAGRTVEMGSSIGTLRSHYDGNRLSALESTEDGNLYRRDFSFNDLDQVTKIEDGVGIQVELTPRFDGAITQKKNAASRVTETPVTKLGERTRTQRANGVAFLYGYNAHRARSSISDSDGEGRSFTYDDQFRLVSQRFRDGSQASFGSFDLQNRPTSIAIPGGNVTIVTDLQGRPLSEAVSLSSGPDFDTTYEYDGLGRATEAAYSGDPNESGGSAFYGYDLLGPLRSARFEEAGQSFSVDYALYPDGTVFEVVYPSGVRVAFERQPSGRIAGITLDGAPLLEIESYAGSALPESQLLGGALRQRNAYDLRKRLLAVRYERVAGGNAPVDLRYAYDAVDNPAVAQRLHRFAEADVFAYDAGQRLISAWFGARPAGLSADPPEQPELAAVDPRFGAAEYARSYAFDETGLDTVLEVETHDAGAFERGPVVASFADHDAFLFATDAEGFARSRDALGNATRSQLAVRPAGAAAPERVGATLVYDGNSQLRSLERDDGVRIEYDYQHTGLLYRRRVFEDGQLASDRRLVWDRGRLIEEYELSNDAAILVGRYYYADDDAPFAGDLGPGLVRHYFLRDRSSSVVAVADAIGQVQERIRYDAYGQAQIELRDDAPPEVERVVVEDGNLLVEFSEPVGPRVTQTSAGSELIGSAQLASLSQALSLSGPEGPLEAEVHLVPQRGGFAPGAILRVDPDQPMPVDEELILTVEPNILADAWGNTQPSTQPFEFSYTGSDEVLFQRAAPANTAPERRTRSALGSPFLFHGQYQDDDAGLLYLRARFYDASAGQFLQRDPSGYLDSPDLYAGFAHNPVSYRDPSGMARVKSRVSNRMTRILKGQGKKRARQEIRRKATTGIFAKGAAPSKNLGKKSDEVLKKSSAAKKRAVDKSLKQKPAAAAEEATEAATRAYSDPRLREAGWEDDIVNEIRWTPNNFDYAGTDKWRAITLRKGDIVWAGANGPGQGVQSQFFTTFKSVRKHGLDPKGTRQTYNKGVQVMEHKRKGYREGLAAFEVQYDMAAAISITRANPEFGEGGLTQIWIRKDSVFTPPALKETGTYLPLPGAP